MKLVLQSVLLKEKLIEISSDETFSSKTYMDLFDGAVWAKYTKINNFCLEIEMSGTAKVEVYSWSEKGERLILTKIIKNQGMQKSSFQFTVNEDEAIYFTISTTDSVQLKRAQYVLLDADNVKKVHLAVIICTYKRNQQVMENIEKLKKSLFFEPTSMYYKKMSIRVVDNASELTESDDEYCKVFHNPNTGGTGGFTRGILESRKDSKEYGITHVIFMDDDVDFIDETFYRLYALLAIVSKEYQENPIAGRMFVMDQRDIQYTAAEIWNKGDLRHVGHNQDMGQESNLLLMNRKLGEYSGWWFACFPIKFVNENLPLPFFIHCDDVEYGLRCEKPPLLLNGVQVWHKAYEYQPNPLIVYYDTRNTIITNVIRKQYTNDKEVIKAFNRKMLYSLKARRFVDSYAMTVAFRDYLKGKTFFVENQNKKIITKYNSLTSLMLATVMFGFVQIENIIKGKRSFQSYR